MSFILNSFVFATAGGDPGGGSGPDDSAIIALFANGEKGGFYNPSDMDTLWQDTAGTTPVTAAGQTVFRMDDKSGNGNNMTSGATNRQPPLRQDAGGKWYLENDDTDDFLGCTLGSAITQPFTRVSAIQQDGWTNGRDFFFDAHFAPAQLQQATSTPRIQMHAGSNGPFTDGLTIGSPGVITEFYSGASSTLTLNDGTPATGNAGTNGVLHPQMFSSGSAAIGRNYGFLFINRALTSPELDDVRQFFADLAGVTL